MFKEKKSENKRKKMIAKIHIGKKYLGLNEDDYKVFLKASAGKESTTDMTVEELKEVLNLMNVAGAFTCQSTLREAARKVGRRHSRLVKIKKMKMINIFT